MKKLFFTGLLLVALLLITGFGGGGFGPAPSWQLTQALAATCVSGNFTLVNGVQINAPTAASERGTLSAPGFPNLGTTNDTGFVGVGLFNFTVFVPIPYSLPANTPLTLSVSTWAGTSISGTPAYVSTMTWNCTTGAIISLSNGVPTTTAACPNPLPAGSTVRNVPLGAPAYYAARSRYAREL